jgi:hypothetical protein
MAIKSPAVVPFSGRPKATHYSICQSVPKTIPAFYTCLLLSGLFYTIPLYLGMPYFTDFKCIENRVVISRLNFFPENSRYDNLLNFNDN